MKVFLFLLLPVFAFGQDNTILTTDETGFYYYQKVIENDKLSEENYNSVKEALVYLYDNSNWTIKHDTKDKIITKGIFTVPYQIWSVSIHHTLTIDIKDNKIRTTFNQLTAEVAKSGEMPFHSKPSFSYSKSFWNKIKHSSILKMRMLNNYLEDSINNESDDW